MSYSPDLRPVVDDVLAPHVGEVVGSVGSADSAGSALWGTLAELGWPLVGVPEERGGAGGSLEDVAELASGVGRHALALPLIESGLAGWVLARAGLDPAPAAAGACVVVAAPGAVTTRPGPDGEVLDGTVPDVPWLAAVRHAVLVSDAGGVPHVTVVDAAGVSVDAGDSLAGEPTGSLRLEGTPAGPWVPAPDGLGMEFAVRESVLRAAALHGAMEAACQLTLRHVQTRRQFGRPLLALQAVGQLVADLAVERDITAAAVSAALAEPGPRLAALVARATAARSAGVVAAGAHQLHGAIGITQEHTLHLFTRRLWGWRDQRCTQRQWEFALGTAILGGAADDELWDLATATST